MSKFAVRSFSDGLRKEMLRFGIKVVTIEPNLYRTAIMDVDILSKSIDQIWDKTDEKVRNDYGGEKFLDKLKARMKLNTVISRPQIHEVIDAQEEAITLCEPELYYRCSGLGERPALWALGHVSESAQDFALTGSVWKRMLLLFKTK
jgi:NAD(P)-dependent dehydrogenase (short-subunit alcohol dehydrogenase family)